MRGFGKSRIGKDGLGKEEIEGSGDLEGERLADDGVYELTEALDDALLLLRRAREELADETSTRTLVTEGHRARTRYEEHERFDITDVTPGDPGWLADLRAAGRRGGVIRQIRVASPG